MSEKDERTANLALYRTAFERLNVQSDFLIKINNTFLLVQGALVALLVAESAAKPSVDPTAIRALANYVPVYGAVLALLWAVAIIQNNHWHRLFTTDLEHFEGKLGTCTELFRGLGDRFRQRMKDDRWDIGVLLWWPIRLRAHGPWVLLALGSHYFWVVTWDQLSPMQPWSNGWRDRFPCLVVFVIAAYYAWAWWCKRAARKGKAKPEDGSDHEHNAGRPRAPD